MTIAMNDLTKNATLLTDKAADHDWWRGAVIYQIYPRSFQDTSGDGIGDLAGIAQRIPYIASLGVDAIWISPFFTSPMKDFGYDVSDYLSVDPMFGTVHDFDDVIAAAHAHGLKVMIDLVISHTADIHPWFVESRSNKDNAKADWYVWADAKDDGSPPNNWLSIFGGTAWEWDSTRCQYYLHNFLTSQPDLNFHNEDVQAAVLDVARFWLDRGVDGFRLDTINFYFHDRQLRDNPSLPVERRNAKTAPAVNPYNFQEHLYSKSQPENVEFLRRLRALMNEYPAIAAVGEIGDSQRGLELMAEYTGGGDKMQMCYAFDFLAPEVPTAESVEEVFTTLRQASEDAWPCWAMSNHDVVRPASRWGDHVRDRTAYMKLLAGLMASLRGSLCIYQGEELGLTEADIAYDQLQDPYGIRFWPKFKGRDGCRTPMVWDGDGVNAGFSNGRPWLPIPGDHLGLAVDKQDHVQGSMLNHYRKILAFRKAHEALRVGTMSILKAEDGILIIERKAGDETILCVFNLSDERRDVALERPGMQAISDHDFSGLYRDGTVHLGAYDAFFGKTD